MKKTFLAVLLFVFTCTKIIAQSNWIDSVKNQALTAKEDTDRVLSFYNLTWAYIWSFADTAAMYAEQGLQLAKKKGYIYGEGLCSIQLCYSLTETGDFATALSFGFKALSIFEKLHDTTLIIAANDALMICYRDEGDYKQALIHGYNSDKLHFVFPAASASLYIAWGNISSVYEKNNQLDSALYYAQKTLRLIKSWSGLHQTFGNIYAKMRNYDMALDYYRKGILFALENFTLRDIVDIYNGMSTVFKATGKIDSSVFYATAAILSEGSAAYPPGVLEASKQLAHLYELKGINDSTVKYLKLASTLNDSLFSKQKTRAAQSFAFNEALHQQELAAQKQEDKSKIRMSGLLAVSVIFLLIGFFLWRNNNHKQIANVLLQKQKDKVESTLSELKATQSQLIQSEKMASLGELTAGIAHEIQNPLNFVNNFSDVNKELLVEMNEEIDRGNIGDAKTIAKNILENEGKINHHGKRADAIVKGMLQHSQASTGAKEPTDINALADEYLPLAFHAFRGKDSTFNATMKKDFDESIGNINIIPQDIGRVLLNLYNNAFYAVNEKKKQQPDGYEPTITVGTKKIGGKVELTVGDNGNGIPKKLVDKIFQPFFTTKPTGQGTGLGLSLAYDIIKAHGGEIKVDTKEGEGSQFIISLPFNTSG